MSHTQNQHDKHSTGETPDSNPSEYSPPDTLYQEDEEALAVARGMKRHREDEPPEDERVDALNRKGLKVDVGNCSQSLRFKPKKYKIPGGDLFVILGLEETGMDDSWTQADEDAVQAQWDSSPERRAFETDGIMHDDHLKLWRMCLRLFDCSPFHILSPLRNLRYHATEDTLNGSGSIVWSLPFSRLFSALLTHPIWHSSRNRLAMALQYAVICRTDDRRVWKMPPTSKCAALKRLEAALGQTKGVLKALSEASGTAEGLLPKPVHSMHMEARLAAMKNRDALSDMSTLLKHLGSIIITQKQLQKAPTTYEGFDIYSVTLRDLWNIETAIDTYSGTIGVPKWTSVAFANKTCCQSKTLAAEPLDLQQLCQFKKRAWIHQLRLFAKARKEPPDEPVQDFQHDEPEEALPSPRSQPLVDYKMFLHFCNRVTDAHRRIDQMEQNQIRPSIEASDESRYEESIESQNEGSNETNAGTLTGVEVDDTIRGISLFMSPASAGSSARLSSISDPDYSDGIRDAPSAVPGPDPSLSPG
ncbi:hypothetical protein B0T10DRAFT_584091 [Thelonectria olida]|uniref:Uncharacterized protein n=1 Tax=Thelonectria olida TaxID=1576542 RepID=A0A9P9AUI2_9HYPO|nr:hypothetical protein B0T10DRAFT_584091 [Thelonectria olida]